MAAKAAIPSVPSLSSRTGFRAHPLAWIGCVWTRLDESRSFGLAAEMAFWLFLALLPIAAVTGLVTAKLALASDPSLMGLAIESLPAATRTLVVSELDRVAAWNGGKVGAGAGIMFVWLASSGVHTIFDGIELESAAKPRPWWKKRLLSVVTCIAVSIALAILALLRTGIGWLSRLSSATPLLRALELESGTAGRLARFAAGALVSFGLVYGLQWVALPRDVSTRSARVAPGAMLTVVLQTVVGSGYGVYLKRAGDGGAYQAGLASIGVTMIALYLFCLMLLVGTRVNEMLNERRP